jgi:hypothetical protein
MTKISELDRRWSKDQMVTLNFTSWSQVSAWLRRLGALRAVA